MDEFGVPKTSAEFSSEDEEILFGKDVNIDDVSDQLDRDGNGTVTIVWFAIEYLQNRYSAYI